MADSYSASIGATFVSNMKRAEGPNEDCESSRERAREGQRIFDLTVKSFYFVNMFKKVIIIIVIINAEKSENAHGK